MVYNKYLIMLNEEEQSSLSKTPKKLPSYIYINKFLAEKTIEMLADQLSFKDIRFGFSQNIILNIKEIEKILSDFRVETAVCNQSIINSINNFNILSKKLNIPV
ncbi:hypothetical protein CHU00_02230 [Sphingobacterium cellulitidis]|nr:hypothetical protein CHU00_02230 [Sphingobacterium cellulitidis]